MYFTTQISVLCTAVLLVSEDSNRLFQSPVTFQLRVSALVRWKLSLSL